MGRDPSLIRLLGGNPLGALGILGVVGALVQDPAFIALFGRFAIVGVDSEIELGPRDPQASP